MSRVRTRSGPYFRDVGRSRNVTYYKGRLSSYPPVIGTWSDDYASGSGSLRNETCRDSLTPGYPLFVVDHPLDIERVKLDPLRINGTLWFHQPYADSGTEYENWCHSSYDEANPILTPGEWCFDHVYKEAKDGVAQAMLDAIANFDPGDPEVDILNFIFEMRDFPRMLKHLGDILLRKRSALNPSEGYLAYHFGWAPLLGDLQKLLEFQKLVDRRFAYLNRVAEGTRLTRRLRDVEEQVITVNDWMNWSWQFEKYKKHDVWYTVHLSSTKLSRMDMDARYQLARSLAFNTRLRPSTVWNSIPWTWLIDWFTNVGTYISYVENRHLYEWSRLNVMWHATGYEQGSILDQDSYRASQGDTYSWSGTGSYRKSVELKLRRTTSTLPSKFFNLGVITNYQAGILAALATSGKIRALLK